MECLTDNKNRAVSEVRLAFSRNGGNMADSGSVSYMFERKGVVEVPKGELTEDALLEVVLESGGAEEINDEGESFEILSERRTSWRCALRCRRQGSTTTAPRRSSSPPTSALLSTSMGPRRSFG